MEGSKKRRWYHKTLLFGSFDYCNDDKHGCNNCAICRAHIKGYCTDCMCEIKITEFSEVQNFAKNMFMTLLCMKNRENTLWHKLDYLVISKIYKLVCFPEVESKKCRMVELECGHQYHRHCYEKWLKRNLHCPLDNKTCVVPIRVENFPKFKFWCKLESIYQVSLRGIDRKKYNLMREKIMAYILNQVKHTTKRYLFQDLYLDTCKTFEDEKLPKKIFKEYVESLISKEYLERGYDQINLLFYVP